MEKKLTKNTLALKISIFNIICNFALFLIKDIASILGNSDSLKADSIHSLSDVFVSIIVFVGIKISRKPPDEKMPFGYDRIECLASIILSFILFAVGSSIGYNSITKLFTTNSSNITSPNLIALIINIFSIVIKILMFLITFLISKKLNYNSLKAEAYHHLTDVFASIGVFLGIAGSMLKISFADKTASIIICIVIIKIALEIFIDASKKMIDYSAPKEINIKINQIVCDIIQSTKIEILSIKTRLFGNSIYILIELTSCEKTQFNDYYIISNLIKDNINANIKNAKNCIISYNFVKNSY